MAGLPRQVARPDPWHRLSGRGAGGRCAGASVEDIFNTKRRVSNSESKTSVLNDECAGWLANVVRTRQRSGAQLRGTSRRLPLLADWSGQARAGAREPVAGHWLGSCDELSVGRTAATPRVAGESAVGGAGDRGVGELLGLRGLVDTAGRVRRTLPSLSSCSSEPPSTSPRSVFYFSPFVV
jgi:hypothetical protein